MQSGYHKHVYMLPVDQPAFIASALSNTAFHDAHHGAGSDSPIVV
jgi:hypothetical protein